MGTPEEDLHKKHAKETAWEMSAESATRQQTSELAAANPGVIFSGAGQEVIVLSPPESGIEKVVRGKNVKQSGAMMKTRNHYVRVHHEDSGVESEYFSGMDYDTQKPDWEQAKDAFVEAVPNYENKPQISLQDYTGLEGQPCIEEHNLNVPDNDQPAQPEQTVEAYGSHGACTECEWAHGVGKGFLLTKNPWGEDSAQCDVCKYRTTDVEEFRLNFEDADLWDDAPMDMENAFTPDDWTLPNIEDL